ncbi:uncharacterized protein UTRI_03639 [Ustilago trichophora]|uniref:Uncharacterized protein n=1 Tax=Ustilago trichophora TaxID=86804 RepID=A0A5C3E4L9_9BASI|nr:uncharacterized protein UTRI_03639 [Ustilago trichophora]
MCGWITESENSLEDEAEEELAFFRNLERSPVASLVKVSTKRQMTNHAKDVDRTKRIVELEILKETQVGFDEASWKKIAGTDLFFFSCLGRIKMRESRRESSAQSDEM